LEEEFNEIALHSAITFEDNDGNPILIPNDENDRERIKNFFRVGQTLTLEDVIDVRTLLALTFGKIEQFEKMTEAMALIIENYQQQLLAIYEDDKTKN
jgi:hypothetical protein